MKANENNLKSLIGAQYVAEMKRRFVEYCKTRNLQVLAVDFDEILGLTALVIGTPIIEQFTQVTRLTGNRSSVRLGVLDFNNTRILNDISFTD